MSAASRRRIRCGAQGQDQIGARAHVCAHGWGGAFRALESHAVTTAQQARHRFQCLGLRQFDRVAAAIEQATKGDGGDGALEDRLPPIDGLGRDIGLGVVNRLPPVRRALIAEAAGLSGDLPALLRGRRL